MSIVKTNKARCRDCYRCLRTCPVKAIKIENGQAYIDESRCISCGNCIYECPQKAKTYRKDIETVLEWLSAGQKLAVSIAPSFASIYKKELLNRIPAVLRSMGFKYVGLTSSAAYHTAKLTIQQFNEDKGKPIIATACPVVVNYISKYMPELVPFMAKVASPMVTHARMIRKAIGQDAKVVFIGPCVAKKTEKEIDAVLTFEEFDALMAYKDKDLVNYEETSFDDENIGYSGLFPLTGGLFRTAEMQLPIESRHIIPVSGFRDLYDLFQYIKKHEPSAVIEPLFCRQGCINAPLIRDKYNIVERREKLITYFDKINKIKDDVDCSVAFSNETVDVSPLPESTVSESDIDKIFEETGKTNPEDRLNCGACGYNSCRDKAIAVLSGMAEKEMCMPYMRRLAEFRSDKIMDTSPNGIVILDEHLNILAMNSTFKKIFLCSDALIDKKISYLIDPEPFESIVTGDNKLFDSVVKYSNYGVWCHVLAYRLPEERKFVGIFVNVTNQQTSQDKLEKVKANTIFKAQDLLEHQINMAQSMAKMLGEYTAKGEELVTNLMNLVEEDK